jgi:hypothetical protein
LRGVKDKAALVTGREVPVLIGPEPGFSIGNPVFAGQIPHAIHAAAQMIAAGEVAVPITATYPLYEIKAPVAHALQGGKLLLEVHGAVN